MEQLNVKVIVVIKPTKLVQKRSNPEVTKLDCNSLAALRDCAHENHRVSDKTLTWQSLTKNVSY